VEVIVALGVPKGALAPLFTTGELVHLSSTSAISIWLVAVGAIVSESRVVMRRAVLPAYGADTVEALFALRETHGSILFHTIRA